MRAFRRISLALYSLLLIASAAGLTALAWNDDKQLDIGGEHFTLKAFIVSDDTFRNAFTVLMVAVALLGLLTLIAAFAPSRPRRPALLRLKQAGGGLMEVEPSVARLVATSAAASVPGVAGVDAGMAGRGGTLDVVLELAIVEGYSVAETSATAAAVTSNALIGSLGLATEPACQVRVRGFAPPLEAFGEAEPAAGQYTADALAAQPEAASGAQSRPPFEGADPGSAQLAPPPTAGPYGGAPAIGATFPPPASPAADGAPPTAEAPGPAVEPDDR